MTRDDTIDALGHYRDRTAAVWFTTLVGLAAETCGDELRHALASVFDLSAVEDASNRLMVILTELQRKEYDLRQRIQDGEKYMDELAKRIDAGEQEWVRLEQRSNKASKAFDDLANRYRALTQVRLNGAKA